MPYGCMGMAMPGYPCCCCCCWGCMGIGGEKACTWPGARGGDDDGRDDMVDTCFGSPASEYAGPVPAWWTAASLRCLRRRKHSHAKNTIARRPAAPTPAPMPALAPVERPEEDDPPTWSAQGRPSAKTLRF